MKRAKFSVKPRKPKLAAAVELGSRGGKVGGPARARSLTPERRTAIAKQGAEERWGHPKS